MGEKTAFIGHRFIPNSYEIGERLKKAVEEQISLGCKKFIMGTHGHFDKMALSVCRELRREHKDIKIEVVITSYNQVRKKHEIDYVPYEDVETVLFDVEELYFKRRITATNRKMIEESDLLICYVNPKRSPSGAKTAMNFAKRQGINTVNLFKVEDDPTYYMTVEELSEYIEQKSEEIKKRLKN